MEDIHIQIIILYMSAWFWQCLALMFLLTSLIMFALPRTLSTQSFYIGLFLVFIGCEFMSLKRKKELKDE